MSVTRFFPWPTVGAWLDRRAEHVSPYAWLIWRGYPEQRARLELLYELCVNGYAIRSARDTVTARIVRNQPRPDWAGEP